MIAKQIKSINYVHFPNACNGGCTFEIAPDEYEVYINADLPRIRQCRALGHELAHIDLGHFYSAGNISDIEAAADRDAWIYFNQFIKGVI